MSRKMEAFAAAKSEWSDLQPGDARPPMTFGFGNGRKVTVAWCTKKRCCYVPTVGHAPRDRQDADRGD